MFLMLSKRAAAFFGLDCFEWRAPRSPVQCGIPVRVGFQTLESIRIKLDAALLCVFSLRVFFLMS